MNATIYGLIDMLFKDTVDTVETRTMREELLNNCLEHYQDLISRGLSETEAIDAVVESLNGMKEIIDTYPKKPEAQHRAEMPKAEEKPVQPEPQAAPAEETPAERIYDPAAIRAIRTNLRSNDIIVNPSDDGMIHIRCDEPKQIICEESGGRLSIRVNSEWKNLKKEGLQPEEMSVKGILNFVGKVLNKVAVDISTAGARVYMDLPEQMGEEIELNSMSGDIEVNGCAAPRMTLHSTSGDIDFKAPEDIRMIRISASSASGDISIRGNAMVAEASSISGDVEVQGDIKSVTMKSTSGDTLLEGAAVEISCHTVSGNNRVILENTDASRIDAASTSGGVSIELPRNTPGVHAAMKSVSGSCRCAFPDAGSGAPLKISASTVSGSIRID